MQKRARIAMQSRALHNSTQKTRTVHRPCKNRAAVLQEKKKAIKSFDFTAFFGAMEGTRTPGLLIRSQSLYPAELPTHTFRLCSVRNEIYSTICGAVCQLFFEKNFCGSPAGAGKRAERAGKAGSDHAGLGGQTAG